MAVTAPESAAGEVEAYAARYDATGAVPRLGHVGRERRSAGRRRRRAGARAGGRGPGRRRAVPGPGDRPRGRVHRPAGHDRRPAAARADRARRADVRPAVADDRLDRAAAEGHRHERADGRRRARAAGVALRRRRADQLPGRGRADLRALHRLRRVPARPHQGSARRWRERARGRRDRHRPHRARRHRRGDPARGRDRRVLHQRDPVHPADRHRGRVRRPDRRVRRALAARPLADGAARQVELVVAEAAAPPARARRCSPTPDRIRLRELDAAALAPRPGPAARPARGRVAGRQARARARRAGRRGHVHRGAAAAVAHRSSASS